MSIQRTNPKKTARKKSDALAVKAPAPASTVKEITWDADGKLIVPPAAFGRLIRAFALDAKAPIGDIREDINHRTFVLLNQVASALHCPHGDQTDQTKNVNFALNAMSSLAPRDGLEAMICGQMVALHSQGMEYLRRAAWCEQTSDGVDSNVNRATRLLRTFAILTESLRAHRGGGKQTVTVEHVTVQAGGQAIVGTVNREVGGGDAQQNGE
jgi:hypothetical protein